MPISGPSSLGVPWHILILADQLTLFQPGGTDYAYLITTGTPGFSDLATALSRVHISLDSLALYHKWEMGCQKIIISDSVGSVICEPSLYDLLSNTSHLVY